MIRRAPRPDAGFMMIRNDVARDGRLSYRASGVLADLLSRPDNWQTSAERLSKARPGREGRDAIRKALRELEAAGYLLRERVRGERGRWLTMLTVYDTPRDAGAPNHDTDDGFSVVGQPGTGNQASAGQSSKEDHYEELKEDDDDQSCARFARHTNGVTTSELDGWRAEDLRLFRTLVGDALASNGQRWQEGQHTAEAFYYTFRRLKKPIKWPGRFMESLHDVDDWLLDQGLERLQ